MLKWIVRLAIAGLLVAGGLYARSWVPRPRPIEMTTEKVGRGTVVLTITNTRAGTIKAHRRARLSPEIGGNAIRIPFRESEAVERGDLMLQLDDSLQRARLELAHRDLVTSEAQQREICLRGQRAVQEHRRILKLSEEEIVSADLADATRSAAATTAAACTAAAVVERARLLGRLHGGARDGAERDLDSLGPLVRRACRRQALHARDRREHHPRHVDRSRPGLPGDRRRTASRL